MDMERSAAVAGLFYPEDPVTLRHTVAELIGPDTSEEPTIAVIAPHAGYVYSGPVAGEVYRTTRVPSTTIVLCPNHTGEGARAAIMSSGFWHVPGQDVGVDETVAEELRDLALLTEDTKAHAREHALEVHLPFLRYKNPRARIVPVCLSHLPYEACVRIGHALADVVTRHGRDVLIVASTDMSHYLPADVARSIDHMAIERIEALDAEGLYRVVRDNQISMCGIIPTTVSVIAAKALGAERAELVRYSNSGEQSGDYSRVVGYAGFVIR